VLTPRIGRARGRTAATSPSSGVDPASSGRRSAIAARRRRLFLLRVGDSNNLLSFARRPHVADGSTRGCDWRQALADERAYSSLTRRLPSSASAASGVCVRTQATGGGRDSPGLEHSVFQAMAHTQATGEAQTVQVLSTLYSKQWRW
jgi:hypothetical protein